MESGCFTNGLSDRDEMEEGVLNVGLWSSQGPASAVAGAVEA